MATRLSRVLFGAFPQLRFEPTAKRIRATIAGHTVVDTLNAYLIWEPRRITPVFAVPENELRAELAPPSLAAPAVKEYAATIRQDIQPGFDPRTSFHKHTAPGEELDVVTPAGVAARAAFRPGDPDLAGYVVLDFDSFDWREDDEEIIGHPRDPFHRVDIRASSVPVEVAVEGVTLAGTTGAQLLYETMLPVRYYLPAADVRLELLQESPKHTVCPYKGRASYYTYPGSEHGRNVAWTYVNTFRDAAQIHGLVCFFNERVDLRVGGVLQSRPVSPWSKSSE